MLYKLIYSSKSFRDCLVTQSSSIGLCEPLREYVKDYTCVTVSLLKTGSTTQVHERTPELGGPLKYTQTN